MAEDKDDELYAQLYGNNAGGDGTNEATEESAYGEEPEEGGGEDDQRDGEAQHTTEENPEGEGEDGGGEGGEGVEGVEGVEGEEQAGEDDEGYEDEDESDEDVVIVLEEKDKQGGSTTPTPTRAMPMHAGKNLSIRNPITIGKGVTATKPKTNGATIAPSPQKESIMNMNLDDLEDKPWRKPGADITDYFNYGFNEDTWKAYCVKQLQLRMEQTMQTKISVWESQKGSDLPPELLAMGGGERDPRGIPQDKRVPQRGGGQRGGGRGGQQQPSIPGNEWERPEPARRRMRDQDDSVIQVVTGGEEPENEYAVPTTGGPPQSPSGFPHPGMEHFAGYPPGIPMGQMPRGFPPMQGQFPRGGRGRGDMRGRGRGGFRERGSPYFPQESKEGGDYHDHERPPVIKEERDSRRREREDQPRDSERESRDSRDSRRRSSSRERADRDKRPAIKEEPRSRESRDRDVSRGGVDTTSSRSDRDTRERDRDRDRERDRDRDRDRDTRDRDSRSRRESDDSSSQKRAKPASSREDEESRAKRRR